MSVSVIIPCLNEEGSISECVRLVKEAFSKENDLEVLVVDNGSTDRSKELAIKAGAKVVDEPRRGYGSAIMRGLKEARGEFLVVGDADNTYDYRDGADLVEALKEGAEFAIGDRINGVLEAGAMPWLHQRIGTPVLTWVLNRFFGSSVSDINCGLRAIRKESVERLKLRSPGMEFASEMVIHAQKAGLKFAERKIRYYRRKQGEAKLRTFRDGWRHLRFILLCAPFPLFFIPSAIVIATSLFYISQERLGFQVLGGGLLLVGVQLSIFGLLAKTYLWVVDSFLVDRAFGNIFGRFRLEHGILISLALTLYGVILLSHVDLASLIRGAWLLVLAVQIFFSSFLISIILMKRD